MHPMNAATEGAPWLHGMPGTRPETEWTGLRLPPCNLLLEGPEEVTNAVLVLLKPHLREPVLWRERGTPLDLPDRQPDTLILQDVGALNAGDQRRLLRWLDDARQPTQVVSTATVPLFSLVTDGHFDSALYYRLNVMLLPVNANTSVRR